MLTWNPTVCMGRYANTCCCSMTGDPCWSIGKAKSTSASLALGRALSIGRLSTSLRSMYYCLRVTEPRKEPYSEVLVRDPSRRDSS